MPTFITNHSHLNKTLLTNNPMNSRGTLIRPNVLTGLAMLLVAVLVVLGLNPLTSFGEEEKALQEKGLEEKVKDDRVIEKVTERVIEKGHEQLSDQQRRAVAVALNYSRASLHRIRKNPSVRVMLEEQEKILNHLDLNGIADEEVLKLYSSILDEISQVQLAERERIVLRERYQRAFQRDLGINAISIAAQAATAQYASAVRTGASGWWDYRNNAATHELDVWQVDKKRMTSVVEKSSQFLDVSWKMARAKKIPDRWLVRSDDLDKLEQAQREVDPIVRLRILKRMEGFMECYPPYLYYVARTQQSLGQLSTANETYQKLVLIGGGHFRKDEMLATGLANQAVIQAYLNQPMASDTARRAMDYSSEAWEANLYCASVLQKYRRFDEAEDAILRNLDVSLERQQSRIALLSLYYTSDNKTKLAAHLHDPEWIKDIPVRQLMLCAAKLGTRDLPWPVVDLFTTSLQGTPRLNLGRDDFVVAISPVWQIQNANVSLQWGDRTFSNPRITGGRESTLLSFDGIVEFGNPLTWNHDHTDVSLVIQYPEEPPLKLVLKPKTEGSKPMEITNLPLVGKRHPVYKVVLMEQSDIRLSFKNDSTSIESLEASLAVPRTVTKPVVNITEDSENDDTVFTAPR
jgi:tetratricopeptide (TPR) repeat protein